MFYEYLGERFRSVFESEKGLWIVSYDHPENQDLFYMKKPDQW